jgi:hypothetical protein
MVNDYCDFTSKNLCTNVFCCPDAYCPFGHISSLDRDSLTQLKLCQYGSKCSDALCKFYHPQRKLRLVCPRWRDCDNAFCFKAHAHKYRPPVCKNRRNCTLASCLAVRLHPKTNVALEDTALWRVFTGVPHLLESFLFFREMRELSLVCVMFNNVFSTHVDRVSRSYGLTSASTLTEVLTCGSIQRFGVDTVLTPLCAMQVLYDSFCWTLQIEKPRRLSLLHPVKRSSLSTFLNHCVSVTSVDQQKTQTQVSWKLLSYTRKYLAIECNGSIDIGWQTETFFKYCTHIDVCREDGVWFTCRVASVDQSTVSFVWPWWRTSKPVFGDVVNHGSIAYPSIRIAPKGYYAYDWKSHVCLGDWIQVRLGTAVYLALVNAIESNNTVVMISYSIGEVITTNLDNDDVYGPSASNYNENSYFNFKNMVFLNQGYKTVLTFPRIPKLQNTPQNCTYSLMPSVDVLPM